jgi:lysosomal acid lipase/cholesteryl ester hydrolase
LFKNEPEPQDGRLEMDTASLVRHHGYPCEEHMVKTDDGFLLTLHRIPRGKGEEADESGLRPPVFLQHGLMQSSECWCVDRRV